MIKYSIISLFSLSFILILFLSGRISRRSNRISLIISWKTVAFAIRQKWETIDSEWHENCAPKKKKISEKTKWRGDETRRETLSIADCFVEQEKTHSLQNIRIVRAKCIFQFTISSRKRVFLCLSSLVAPVHSWIGRLCNVFCIVATPVRCESVKVV